MLLKFMTMNTEDENRDEIEAQEVGITFLKLIRTNDDHQFLHFDATSQANSIHQRVSTQLFSYDGAHPPTFSRPRFGTRLILNKSSGGSDDGETGR